MYSVETQAAEKVHAQLTKESGFTLFDDSGYDAATRAEREFWRVADSLDGITVNRAMLTRVAKRNAEHVTQILGVLANA